MRAPVACVAAAAALLLAAAPGGRAAPGETSPLQGEVWCFCNLPQCVTTSYMCKSRGAGCFSDLSSFQDVYEALHGCVDMLDRERQQQCAARPGADSAPRLRCCHRDMCNHVDSPEIHFMYNDSLLGSANSSETTHLYLNNLPRAGGNEAWFKVATIVVPILGAAILLLLVGLALRILRKEHDRLARHGALFKQQQPQPPRYPGEPFSKRAPLLLLRHQNEVSAGAGRALDKNAARAKLNSPPPPDYSLLAPLHRDSNLRKAEHASYRDVNLTLAIPPCGTAGKLYDKHHVGSWGEVPRSASHV
ncbi:BMP and activin membrane-bound inhibitor homolog [Bacillus rossius redtenbacheri]|uniref:BMP and activin membrane-bound inhibitor homolog n=1 Tax=Bacillus rossius redtenbacheri TaxID=93214 RepID=UPI002FDE8F0A